MKAFSKQVQTEKEKQRIKAKKDHISDMTKLRKQRQSSGFAGTCSYVPSSVDMFAGEYQRGTSGLPSCTKLTCMCCRATSVAEVLLQGVMACCAGRYWFSSSASSDGFQTPELCWCSTLFTFSACLFLPMLCCWGCTAY